MSVIPGQGVLSLAEGVAFIGVRDLAAAAHFYEQQLGLAAVESTAFANVYDIGGTTLRVTRVSEVVPAAYTVLGWKVPDIANAMLRLRDAGVSFERYRGLEQDVEGVWTAPGGSLIAWFRDPDANTLSLQQAPRD